MDDLVCEMMRLIMPAILDGNRQTLRAIERMDNDVDTLPAEIVGYLGNQPSGLDRAPDPTAHVAVCGRQ
ncbi:MAG: hypothetical protein ACUVT0_02400 [Thermochromatium sp.]